MQFLTRQLDRLSLTLAPLRNYLGAFGWGALVVFMIQRGTDVANLICKVFLGRILPPLDFGAVEPIIATVAILAIPAHIIYTPAVNSISRLRSQGHDAQCRALIRDLQVIATAGSILSIVIVYALRNFILTRLHLESSFFVWMIALMFSMSWWSPLMLSIIRAEHNYRLLMLSKTLGPILLVILTVTLVGLFDFGLKGAIAARITGGLLTLCLFMTLIRKAHQGDYESYHKERRLLLKMLFPMAIFIVSSAVAVSFDRLFVRNFMLEDSPGLSAIFMLGQIPSLAVSSLVFVLFPIAAAEHASGKELGRLLRKAVLVAALITVGFCLLFSTTATPLLRFWRPEFARYGDYVWIYALMTGTHALNSVIAQVELARHKYRFLWFYSAPIFCACVGIYMLQDYTSFEFTIPTLLWILITAHTLTTLSTLAYLHFRTDRSEPVLSSPA